MKNEEFATAVFVITKYRDYEISKNRNVETMRLNS